MRYRLASALAVGLIPFALQIPTAHAQLGGGLGSFSLGAPAQNAQPQTIDKIVAVVDQDVILQSELDAAVAQFKQQSGGQTDNVPPNVLRSQVLDQLIMRQLQIQQAQKEGIKVTPAELQQGLSRIAQRNNMDLAQFQQAVTQSGMDLQSVRDRVHDEILISKVRQKDVMQKVGISDADVDRYLQNQALRFSRDHQYHLAEIRLDLPADADSTTAGVARDRLQRLRARITAGDLTFAQAARQVSDAASADNGGDLGWVAGTDVPDSFDAALSDLSDGQISDVFRGDDGLYLLQLEDERGGQADDSDDSSTDNKVMVTEADLQHIVLKPNTIRDEARTRQLAQTIRQRLSAGDDFSALARQYSDDSGTANQGGDVGWIPLNRLAPSTRRQIQDLSAGDVSRVFQSGNSYEIVKVNGKRQRDETQEAKRDKIRQTLGKQRAAEQGNLWLRKLRDEAYVDIRMPDYQPTPGSDS
ncbi:peptidylprolyl isomerase [Salinisphaera sp. Q1T1-3]|uniref:peptidylprolyl isomerase n=1 Tax=Salinisphaera sp. Q1T1-3 TaxID=2321229 RepID=UPI000E77158A|nr:peptidylprolyl isomerase [Salinisphaera sp. Q1T1-3]RJS94000.1 hypothetical protein D3260_05335 [Salinisphaera sp. Q1T1-3]